MIENEKSNRVTEYLQYLFDFFWHNFKKFIHYQLYLTLSIIHFISNMTRCLLQLSISVSECIPELSTVNATAARFPRPWDEHLAINTSTTFDHVLLQLGDRFFFLGYCSLRFPLPLHHSPTATSPTLILEHSSQKRVYRGGSFTSLTSHLDVHPQRQHDTKRTRLLRQPRLHE